MKKNTLLLIFGFIILLSYGQDNNEKSNFWDNVQFGGGLNIGFSNQATVIGVSPSAIYNFSDEFGLGTGVSYLYSKYKNRNTSLSAYGISALGVYKPFDGMQLSAEFEETFISQEIRSYQIPALYLGAGYNIGRNISAGVRFDVLYDENKSLYASPLTPFFRVYF